MIDRELNLWWICLGNVSIELFCQGNNVNEMLIVSKAEALCDKRCTFAHTYYMLDVIHSVSSTSSSFGSMVTRTCDLCPVFPGECGLSLTGRFSVSLTTRIVYRVTNTDRAKNY